ncbi:hypothetical protein HAX54_021045 [Datura stramonium]|uniref:Brix domain-containing protein n=1 Tax=Datura stramonium TaxID=4076 RepID=A0ABS8UUF9_DATST|nr:hypothetical protein [Datura stramonium]
MGRKRKHVETEAAAKDETAIERPKRTQVPEGKRPLSVDGQMPQWSIREVLVNAVHTMEELKLTGNHLKGSRPILTFSSNFDRQPHWKLLKEMFIQILELKGSLGNLILSMIMYLCLQF